MENTVFSYAILLSVYLLGTAGGAAFYQTRLKGRPFGSMLCYLLTAQALTCMAGLWILGFTGHIYEWIGIIGVRTAEVGVSVTAFFGPTLVMGALFSHLAQAAKQHPAKGLGTALAVNTAGSALAPFLFGIVLMPLFGPTGAMLAICMGYLMLLPNFRGKGIRPIAGFVVGVGLYLTIFGHFDFNDPVPGEEVVIVRHGVMADVAVVRDARQAHHLKVNNHYRMGGTSSHYSDHRQAHIPLLLHPDPKNVLFLGLGTLPRPCAFRPTGYEGSH